MDPEVRNVQNRKQVNIKFTTGGVPSPSDIVGIEIRKIIGRGIYLIIKDENKLYFLKFSESL